MSSQPCSPQIGLLGSASLARFTARCILGGHDAQPEATGDHDGTSFGVQGGDPQSAAPLPPGLSACVCAAAPCVPPCVSRPHRRPRRHLRPPSACVPPSSLPCASRPRRRPRHRLQPPTTCVRAAAPYVPHRD
ncbi:hypothetical protein DAI22_10g094001 [Oryza sativa Japonica Group]|nr:hypothetical protein DAI22_10g094001 [Oryza sativa Japonica Group]